MTAREEFVKAMRWLGNHLWHPPIIWKHGTEKPACRMCKELRALAVAFHTQNCLRCDPKKCAHAIVFLRDCGLEERDDD